jgi:hypothetical protein
MVTAVTAPAVGPCPPRELEEREGSRRSRPARRSRCGHGANGGPVPTMRAGRAGRVTAVTPGTEVTAEPIGGHGCHGGHGPLGDRAGGPDGAGRDDFCDHGDHGAHAGHSGHGAIAEPPCGARTPHSNHGSRPPSERIRLRPAGGAPTTLPERADTFMRGVEAPSYLSPENSHVIESLSNRRQKGKNLSVMVPTFLRLIEARVWAEVRVEVHLRLPLHALAEAGPSGPRASRPGSASD